jgi:hypothetical protein
MSVPAGASKLNVPGMVVAADVVAQTARRAVLSLMVAGGFVRDSDWYLV